MNWVGVTLLCLMTLSLGMDLVRHGQKKTGKHNFWSSLLATLIVLTIYYFGGLLK